MGIGAVAALSVLLFVLARYVIARALTGLAARTQSKYDDILVRNLRPNRMAWFAPLLVIYTNAYLFPDAETLIAKAALFVDSRATTLGHIGELLMPLASGAISEASVLGDLYDLVRPDARRRLSDDEITLYKNGGGAHLDLMIASWIAQVMAR